MITRREFIKKAAITCGIGGMAAGYPVFIERYIVRVNTYQIPVPNLPRAFENFRIAHLTDLHYGPLVPEIFIKGVIDRTNRIEKDMIVCTGDYVHGKQEKNRFDTVFPILGRLKARYGVYSVLGNHDHWAGGKKAAAWLDNIGQNIRHKVISVEKDGHRIQIGGIGDLWEDDPGIDQTFQYVPESDCKIALAHNPDTADTRFDTRIDLMISGHTHGGQVNIPFVGTPVLPVKNERYSSGFIRTPNTNLFISRGIGWAIIPVRFNCFPEIAVLNLVPDKAV